MIEIRKVPPTWRQLLRYAFCDAIAVATATTLTAASTRGQERQQHDGQETHNIVYHHREKLLLSLMA